MPRNLMYWVLTVVFTFGALAPHVQSAEPVEKAQPKKGKTHAPPLSENLPDSVRSLSVFGSIQWETHQLPWVEEGPDAGISGMAMVAREGKIYVCGGFIPGGDGSDDKASHRTSRGTWMYDPVDMTWTQLPDAPIRREYVRAVATKDTFFLIGGACQYKGQDPPYRVHGDCVALSLSGEERTWREHSQLNVPRTHTSVGCVSDHLLVAGGNEYDFGQGGYSPLTIRNTVEVFDLGDPEKGWRKATPIPGLARGWCASVVANESLYLLGGVSWTESDGMVGTQETLRYDPKADRWDCLTPPPLAISGWEGDLYANRYALAVGGVVHAERGDDLSSLVWSDLAWAYDTKEDRWLRVGGALPPGAVFNDPGVAVVDDTLYVMGAEGPHGSHYNFFLVGRIVASEE